MTRIRVLLVEDNPADVELFQEMLSLGQVAFELSVATDGEEALRILHAADQNTLPQLMILDLNLPRISGKEILNQIKQDELLRMLPVVILSSSDAERDIIESYGLGANCYVLKPVDLADFQSAVRGIEEFWLSLARLPKVPPVGA